MRSRSKVELEQLRELHLQRAAQRVPKAQILELFGFDSHAAADRFARRYDCPIRGKTVDLGAVIRWMHDWLDALDGARRVEQLRTAQRREADGRFARA